MDDTDSAFFEKQGFGFISVVGKGGFGVIFEVFSFQYKAKFALKRIPKKGFAQNEVECMRSIDSNLVVNLFQYYEFEDRVYMLLELCQSSLEKVVLKEKKLIKKEIDAYVEGVIKSVNVCHQNKISHGDIKPSNFLIDNYNRVKIADFGLSNSFVAESMTFAGTIAFLAPEILAKKPYDPFKADIWAVGITIYFIATRKFPWCIRKKSELLNAIEAQLIDFAILPNDDYRNLVKKCLNLNPKLRPTCEELLSLPMFKKVCPLSSENKTFCIGDANHKRVKTSLTIASKLLIQNNIIKASRRITKASSEKEIYSKKQCVIYK